MPVPTKSPETTCSQSQSYDFIRKFELDVNLDGYPGVSRVMGTNRMQTAYMIDSTANLIMPTL